MAKEIGLPIITVIAEQMCMPLWLRHLQALDISNQMGWQVFLNAVGVHIGLLESSQKACISMSPPQLN